GNLYCLNSGAAYAIVKRNTEGEWSGFMDNALVDKANRSMRTMTGSILDHQGRIWFVNAHSDNPSLYCYEPQENSITKYNNFVNQDGTKLQFSYTYCVCEDLAGNIWIGTDVGPMYLSAEEIADPSRGFIQYKVPRNDGTNYADYLLSGISISFIAVDKAGRKWFGTNGDGVYLISEDNNTQEQHFTESNSKLLSNTIESIAINNNTGEVFFGTSKGLCSYVSDATTSNDNMDKDNVWAYPNPVTPDYTGLITIKGLSFNTDVKICNASGTLIAEGHSNGGTFTWDGCDKNGNQVASGVYMVLTAKSDGSKGTVCKIAIIR
ncbi:MAG: Por secretion system protein, partial [Prevotella sp.]|nr:Por secretion system protein [Prevotella sp.]